MADITFPQVRRWCPVCQEFTESWFDTYFRYDKQERCTRCDQPPEPK